MFYTVSEIAALASLDNAIATSPYGEMGIATLRTLRSLINRMDSGDTDKSYDVMWDKKRAEYAAIRAAEKVQILHAGKRALHVVAPYNKGFYDAAKAAGGVWKPRTQIWTFRKHTPAEIREMCKTHYPAEAFRAF